MIIKAKNVTVTLSDAAGREVVIENADLSVAPLHKAPTGRDGAIQWPPGDPAPGEGLLVDFEDGSAIWESPAITVEHRQGQPTLSSLLAADWSSHAPPARRIPINLPGQGRRLAELHMAGEQQDGTFRVDVALYGRCKDKPRRRRLAVARRIRRKKHGRR